MLDMRSFRVSAGVCFSNSALHSPNSLPTRLLSLLDTKWSSLPSNALVIQLVLNARGWSTEKVEENSQH